jgi:5-methyltetrahydropteroyltriglutamate--homocysteine methyltransferase
VGAIDVASDTIESPEEVAAVIRKTLKHVDARRLHPYTNCGMAPMDRRIAEGKLAALAQGAAMVRHEMRYRG